MNKITISNLTWQPDKKQKSILSDINLEINKGGFIGILGPNGAGKTSLIKQILNLVKHDFGEIKYDDALVETFSRREIAKRISVLTQNNFVDVDFKVYDIVAMGREPYRNHFKPLDNEDIKIINDALNITDCMHLKEKSITKLSGGELQRVMIARTIAMDTPWIILDEPVSSLDIKHQTDIMNMLERLHREKGKTVIAILHDINLAKRFCTDLIFMKDGSIVANGSREKVLSQEILKAVYDIEFEFICDKSGQFIIPVL